MTFSEFMTEQSKYAKKSAPKDTKKKPAPYFTDYASI